MMTFDPNDTRLTAYALGELEGSERTEIEQLLAASPEARAELAEIQEAVGLLQTQLASEPAPELTTEQRQRLEQHIVAQAAGETAATRPDVRVAAIVPVSPHRTWVAVAGSLAASAVAVAIMLPAMQQSREANGPKAIANIDATKMSTESESLIAANDAPAARELALGRDESLSERQLAESGRRLAVREKAGQSNADAAPLKKPVDSARLRDARKDRSFGTEGLVEREAKQQTVLSTATADPAGAPPAMSKTASLTNAPGMAGKPIKSDGTTGVNGTPSLEALRTLGGTPTPKAAAESAPAPIVTKGLEMRGGQRLSVVAGQPEQPKTADEFSFSRKKMNAGSGPAEGKPFADLAKSEARQADAKASKEVAALGLKSDAEPKDRYRVVLDRLQSDISEKLQQKVADKVSTNESYDAITENDFATPIEQPLSTFSIDVDSASYANARRFLTQGQLPPADSVRVEEFVNYFRYDYKQPAAGEAFSVTADVASCPWQKDNYLARVGLKAKDIDKSKRPPTNLVFLIDVSGSMQPANKLPLVKRGLTLLVEEMGEQDHIAIVTYAGDAGVKLAGTKGSDQLQIMQVIDGLHAGGSTNGASGISLAYEQALRSFNKEGENRVILCTDGDFNVGISSDDELVKLIQAQAKSGVFLSVFGFGMGNLKDSKLEKLADKGNGHYGYIDDLNEARKVFNEELVGTLYTVAKDVKLQVEFNPLTVGAYRLIGYENRALAAQDFNDDTKDAGEIGAGHTVTALYEIVPAGHWPKAGKVDDLKYAAVEKKRDEAARADAKSKLAPDVADDLFTVKLRYKQPNAETSARTVDYVVDDIAGKKDVVPNRDLVWAASVANFAMHLRHSKHAGSWTLEDIVETAAGAKGEDPTGRKSEFVDLVKAAQRLQRQ